MFITPHSEYMHTTSKQVWEKSVCRFLLVSRTNFFIALVQKSHASLLWRFFKVSFISRRHDEGTNEKLFPSNSLEI